MGNLIGLCCPQYNERPQIAQVLSVEPAKIRARWFDGGWSKKWSVYTYRQNRKLIPWDGDVDMEHVVSSSVKLTPRGVLSAGCKRELRKLYNK